jgi:TRAP-type transport system periplasmic protein
MSNEGEQPMSAAFTTATARLPRRRLLAGASMTAGFAIAGGRRASAAPQFTLRLSTWGAPGVPQVAVFVDEFTKTVTKASNGAIGVQHFPAGSLAKEQDVAPAVQTGVVDISLSMVGNWSASVPAAALLNSILFAPTDEQMESVVGAGTKLFARLSADLRKHGAILLATLTNGAPTVVSHGPMNAPGDFRGKLVRVYDRETSLIVQTLGGSPSTISVSEVYPALQRGTVQAAIGGLQGAAGLKEYEVAKYLLLTNGVFGLGATLYVMNKTLFDRMPPNLQQAVLAAGETAEKAPNPAIIHSFTVLRDQMQQHGMTVDTLQPGTPAHAAFTKALKPLADQQRAKLPPDLVKELADAIPH